MITRRELMLGSVGAVGALTGGCRLYEGAGNADKDPDLSVFISDMHCATGGYRTKWGAQPTGQNAALSRVVDEILAMRPRPARVVAFGDVALWFGLDGDYDEAKIRLDRIAAAGIDLYVTTGNHDHREPFFAHFPRQAEMTPVPGRAVSVIDLGRADLLLLDTLDEAPGAKAGDHNRVGGAMDEAQFAWLAQEAKRRSRPFFCGAHHAPTDLNGKNVRDVLNPIKNFVGWIHGHDHKFSERWFAEVWGQPRIRRIAVLPSTGWWGDIGYGLFRTYDNRAVYSLVVNDYYFPEPPKPGTPRPPEWDTILNEHRGRTVTFDYLA